MVLKEATVRTIEALALRTGLPLFDASGVRRFGGHTGRATGAQFLAGLHLTDAIETASWPDARAQLADWLSVELQGVEDCDVLEEDPLAAIIFSGGDIHMEHFDLHINFSIIQSRVLDLRNNKIK